MTVVGISTVRAVKYALTQLGILLMGCPELSAEYYFRKGDASYPLDYVYDNYGRMTQLKTYRDSNLNNPDITTWAYQESTGLLTSKTYADNNSVSYTYSNEGKLATRTWSRDVVTTYSYNLAGDLTGISYSDSTPSVAFTYNRLGQQLTVTDAVGSRTFGYNGVFQLTSEAITGIYNKTLNRSYDMLGRSSGVNIGTEYAVGYGYDALGRISTVTNGNDTFTYSYLPNSNLIQSITYPSSITSTKSYESNRDLVTSIENKYGTTTISKYDYSNDDLGRRIAMAKSGTAFSQSDTISYGYNDKSEVTSAVAQNQATYNYGFNFDSIGNRITSSSTETGMAITRNYIANQLNQYTAIDNPEVSPTYDDDGNAVNCPLSSGNWTNTWNGENQLLAQEKSDARLEFKYDYKGRRVEKKSYSGSIGSWTLNTHLKFVYDGYLQVEKLNALDSNTVERKRIWGAERLIVDINSSGVTTYAFGDANKNITEYIDASGVIQSHYEFSPFGKVTIASGANPDDFEFRFSSEYLDNETGLVYYNYRYYSPEMGKWFSRDPIGEKGGKNLYGFVHNLPLSKTDLLGRHCKDCPKIFTNCKNMADSDYELCKEGVVEQARDLLNELTDTANEQFEKLKKEAELTYNSWVNNTCSRIDRNTLSGAIEYQVCTSGGLVLEETAIHYALVGWKEALIAADTAVAAFTAGQMYKCVVKHELALRDCRLENKQCVATYGLDEKGCPCKK